MFTSEGCLTLIVSAILFGAVFGVVWAARRLCRVPRQARLHVGDSQVVATRYEVLVEHKHAERARELLAKLPGGLPDPFA